MNVNTFVINVYFQGRKNVKVKVAVTPENTPLDTFTEI